MHVATLGNRPVRTLKRHTVSLQPLPTDRHLPVAVHIDAHLEPPILLNPPHPNANRPMTINQLAATMRHQFTTDRNEHAAPDPTPSL